MSELSLSPFTLSCPFSSPVIEHFPQPIRSHIQSLGTLGQLLKIPPLSPIFVSYEPMQNFGTL